jgi:hypothetical protein
MGLIFCFQMSVYSFENRYSSDGGDGGASLPYNLGIGGLNIMNREHFKVTTRSIFS